MKVIDSLENFKTLELMEKANKIHLKRHGKDITLERAVFLSWWCDKGDCAFCYMSTQKPKIKDPLKARRSINSILAEAELCKRLGWNIEFLSGGYGSFSTSEIKKIASKIYEITNHPVWLNTGISTNLAEYGEEIVGITGAVEVVNPKLHDKICPSKSLEDIGNMLAMAGDLGFKKAITIILGLGETPHDLEYLFDMIRDGGIQRITFYSLNPHPGTPYENQPSPSSLYYAGIVAATRITFPDLEIICGTWIDNLANIGPLLLSGANGLTKFPLFKMFGTRYGKRVEEEVFWSGRNLKGTFSDYNLLLDNSSTSPELDSYVKRYIDKCLNNKSLSE